MVTDKATSVTVSDILASACGDLRPAMTAVAQLANQELIPGGTDDQVSLFQNFQESWKLRKHVSQSGNFKSRVVLESCSSSVNQSASCKNVEPERERFKCCGKKGFRATRKLHQAPTSSAGLGQQENHQGQAEIL